MKAEKKGISIAQYVRDLYNIDVSDTYKMLNDVAIPYIKDKQTVLEIGTGTGSYTEIILEKYPNLCYYSFEPNDDFKDYLTRHFLKYNFKSMPSKGNSLEGVRGYLYRCSMCLNQKLIFANQR